MPGKIYVLVDPRDGEIRYVGLTTQTLEKRYKLHLYTSSCKKTHCAMWIKHLQNAGHQPVIRLVQEISDEHVSAAEVYWIFYFRSIGCRLVNHTDGGEGGMRGHRHSAETRAKMSASHVGMTGKTLTDEHKAKISILHKGRHRSNETKCRIAAARTGKLFSDEAKKKMSDAAIKRWKRTKDDI